MYVVLGKVYENLKEISEEYNININNIRHYIKSHGEDKLEKYIIDRNIKVNGLTFKNRGEACKHFGVKYNSVYEKEKKERISTEEAINKLIQVKERKRIYVRLNGKEFKSIRDLAKYLEVNEKTLSRYIKRYGDCNKAIERVKEDIINVREKRESDYKLFGKSFKSKKEIASYFELSYNTISKSKNLSLTISTLVYERDILDNIGDIYIIKLGDTKYFVLDSELEKILLRKEYDEKFLLERKLE